MMRKRRLCLLVGLSCVFLRGLLDGAAAEPALRSLPALPEPPQALLADAGGQLYAHAGGLLFLLEADVWSDLEFTGLVDITTNAAGTVFARCAAADDSAVIYRLEGKKRSEVLQGRMEKEASWYVDAEGRAWCQSKDALIVLQEGRSPLRITSQRSEYGFRLRDPCEWKPGHVVLFHGTTMVVATPRDVRQIDPPRFAADGTGKGPVPLGKRFLVSGGSNNVGMGTYLLDTSDLTASPRRVRLGWDWFHAVASVPDGRALVLAQTDRNPRFTLFWYAADGQNQVQLEGADDIIRAKIVGPVRFNTKHTGFAVLGDGSLGVFDPQRARVVTPASGLPVSRVIHVAAVGDNLAIAGADGRVFMWDTRFPLPAITADAFAQRGRWPLAGPCCVDAGGVMWAFLADFPGRVSRFDGRRWEHVALPLGRRRPLSMSADDRGNLHVAFESAPAGSDLIQPDKQVVSYPDEPRRAWQEAVRGGSTRFFDGSSRRPTHWTCGDGRIWFYDGRELWDSETVLDYYDRPPYRTWWVGADGDWYRGWPWQRYRQGRWVAVADPPSDLRLGRDGLYRAGGAKSQPTSPADSLPVTADEGGLVAIGPRWLTRPDQIGDVKDRLRLEGDETWLPAAGGGWVGNWRYLQGLFVSWPHRGRVFEAAAGRYFLEDGQLEFHPRRDLRVTGDLAEDKDKFTLTYQVAGSPEASRVLVLVDGAAQPQLATSGKIEFPLELSGSEVELWGLDQAGNASRKPARFRLPAANVKRPQWQVLSGRVTSGGVTYTLENALAVDRYGHVFANARRDARSPITILRRDHLGNWHTVQTGEQQPRYLTTSPDGRVYAISPASQWQMSVVAGGGLRPVTNVYYDSRAGDPLKLLWDDRGGLWNAGLQWVGRWNGATWDEWKIPLNWNGRMLAGQDGRMLLLASGRFWVYDGTTLKAHTLPDDWQPLLDGQLLGKRHVAMLARQEIAANRHREGWVLFNLDTNELEVDRWPPRAVIRTDGLGNLIVWDVSKQRLERISGEDLSAQELEYVAPPDNWREDDGTMLRTPGDGGGFVVSGRRDVTADSKQGGPQRFDWRSGLQFGRTVAGAVGPDGRVWLLRDRQLAVFDPAGDPSLNATPFEGWRELHTASTCRGFNHQIWYIKADRSGVVLTDGDQEKEWKLNGLPAYGNSIVVTSDRDEAIVAAPLNRRWLLLLDDGTTQPVNDVRDGIVALVRRGGRRFHAATDPPVVNESKTIYYDGQVWDGQTWKPTYQGRAVLDTLERILVISQKGGVDPTVHRLSGDAVEPLESEDRFLIDEYGLRWFDAGQLEAQPGRFPVVYRDGGNMKVALDADAEHRFEIARYIRTAVQIGKRDFLLLTDYSGHYRVNENGVRLLDYEQFPFGGDKALPHALAMGRWAWICGASIFVSPANCELKTVE